MRTQIIVHSRFRWLSAILLITLLLLSGPAAIVAQASAFGAVTWDPSKLYGTQATTLYDKNNKSFFSLHASENRISVPLKRIPKNLINAFVATEDRDFYQHHGVSVTSILRAAVVDIVKGSKAQGASTITQQLAKNAFLKPEKTFSRKAQEMMLAIEIEQKYTKNEIMEFYVNKIYFGAGAWGAQTAAQTYFGKDVKNLNLSECSLLAGLVQAPSRYNPYRNLSLAKKRQRVVLNNMVTCKYLTKKQADQAFAAPLKFMAEPDSKQQYGHYVDYVVDEADRILRSEGYSNPQETIFKGGLKIYTAIDPKFQAYAEKIYANPANFPKGKSKQGQIIQSAMVLLDHQTGQINALVGGRNTAQQRGFNRAVDALRQPGSSFKPLVVYGPALEKGISPDYILDDAPVSYEFGGKTWSPGNYDGKYLGPISMRTAIQWSVNVYAVKLAEQIGIKNGLAFAKKLGISSLVLSGARNDNNLSSALGGITQGVSPLQMASAYGCFANQGLRVSPYVIVKITDNEGNAIYSHIPQKQQVMKKETAWLMTSLLQNVVQAGTGTKAQIPGIDCAGKTGTTQDDRDAWFAGYTPRYSCVVWMGYDKKESMNNTYGGSYPARIWKAIMTRAMAGKAQKEFSMPSNLSPVSICGKSGKIATAACPPEDVTIKYLAKEAIPQESCDLHVQIEVCSETGKLAVSGCPNPVKRGFLKGAIAGDSEAAPTEYCSIHPGDPLVTQQKPMVIVCTDPRHTGTPYLANIPKEGENGGCPRELIQEKEVDDPGSIPYCPIIEHQIKK
ncbi:MAG: transglycosylase domain-containing protein [Acidobacteriota bacterium]